MRGKGVEVFEASLVAGHVLRPVLSELPDSCSVVMSISLAVLCGGQI